VNGTVIHLAAATAAALAALIFLRAALHKTADMARFEGVLANYGLAPDAALRPLSRLIPVLETAGAAMLVLAPMAGAWLTGALLVGYAGAMAINLARGRSEIDCGCGGAPEPLGWARVARNLVLALALAPAALGAGGSLALAEAAVAWALALIGFCCWGAAEQLGANRARMADASVWSRAS
jgi:Methylamine utilisation protein MauE